MKKITKGKKLLTSQPLFEQWPDGLLVLDSEGHIVSVNTKAGELLGYLANELEGRLLHSALCGQAADYQHKKEFCPFSQVQKKLPVNHILDAWFIQKNGIYLHVDVKNVARLSDKQLRDLQLPGIEKNGEQSFGSEAFEDETYFIISFQDCSSRRYSEKELQRLALFAELNPSPIIEFNEQSLIYFSNPAMVELIAELGFDHMGMPCVLPVNLKDIIAKCLATGKTLNNIETESRGRWFLWNFHPVLERSLVQGYGLDITYRKEAEELLFAEKERFLVTLESIDDAVITIDMDESVLYLNSKASELTGCLNVESVGKPFNEIVKLFHTESRPTSENIIKRAISENISYRAADTQFLAHRDGYVISVKQTVSPMRNNNSDVIGAVIALHDITDAKKMEQSLNYQATHDALTGLIERKNKRVLP